VQETRLKQPNPVKNIKTETQFHPETQPAQTYSLFSRTQQGYNEQEIEFSRSHALTPKPNSQTLFIHFSQF
jgi:hypothetical protein